MIYFCDFESDVHALIYYVHTPFPTMCIETEILAWTMTPYIDMCHYEICVLISMSHDYNERYVYLH